MVELLDTLVPHRIGVRTGGALEIRTTCHLIVLHTRLVDRDRPKCFCPLAELCLMARVGWCLGEVYVIQVVPLAGWGLVGHRVVPP